MSSAGKNTRKKQILRFVWESGETSRKEIADALEINLPAVSYTVNELLESKELVETTAALATGGRRASLLKVAPDRYSVIAVSYSSLGLLTAVSDLSANLVNIKRKNEDSSLPIDKVLSQIQAAIQEQLEYVAANQLPEVCGIGVGISGLVDQIKGISISFPRRDDWQNIPLRKKIRDRFKLPVSIGNRINAITLAESVFGKYHKARNFIYVHLGPGIGQGMCLNGNVYYGPYHSAGELGHVIVDPNGEMCYCGNYGCLETLASDAAIIRKAKKGLQLGVQSRISELNQHGMELTTFAIFQAAADGDRFARNLVEEVGESMGLAISNQINLFAPQCVILGGTMTDAVLFDVIKRQVEKRILGSLIDKVLFVKKSFGMEEGLKGAATLALKGYFYRED